MIRRSTDEQRLREGLRRAPVVLLVGPRQAGKSTLARSIVAEQPSHWFDAEDPVDLARLADLSLALRPLRGLVTIDEAQHVEDLFPLLRVLADRPEAPARFLILGSASPDLVGLAAESLAGRVEIIELAGLRGIDVGDDKLDLLWLRGGLPRSYVAPTERVSTRWRDNYITTFLNRDLPSLGVQVPVVTMRRAWTMLAHYHGQTWNGAEVARALDVSQPSVRRYVDALTGALVVRQLQPWYANVGKRQVRSPRVYVRDSGVLHRLLGIDDPNSLLANPKVGASWEGFVIEQLAAIVDDAPMYFWRTQNGAEIDVYMQLEGRRVGFEIKRTSTPRMTPSIRHALSDLELDGVFVLYPGQHRFQLAERVEALPLAQLLSAADRYGLLDLLARQE